MDHRKLKEFKKKIYFCFIDYAKVLDCVAHNKLWKILKEKGKTDHITYLLINLYIGQKEIVRTGHETMECFIIEKEYIKATYDQPAHLISMQSSVQSLSRVRLFATP